MMSSLLCLLLLLPCLLSATPFRKDEEESILLRIARLTDSKNQSNTFRCQQNGECAPSGFKNVPADLVSCVASKCVCNMCFMKNSTGQCQTCSDYKYSTTQGVCGADNRPTQLIAFLLTFFMSSTGAANFYIGQNKLGGGQLFLLFLTIAMAYSMCCLCCCICCGLVEKGTERMEGSKKLSLSSASSKCKFIFLVLAIVIVVCGSIAMWAWWIADLVIFASNRRLSGNGCELKPNL